jgi:integrase
MPKTSKYPKLRVYVKRGRAGQVWKSWAYDMRGTGKPDIPLGNDYDEALRRYHEIHHEAPRRAGTIEEAFGRWELEVLPTYGSKVTRDGYAKNLRQLRPVFSPARWDEIDLPTLKAYLRKRTGKVQANRELSLLSVVWNWARGEGLTDLVWPAHGMERSKWKNPEQAREFEVTPEIFAAIYAEADRVLRDCMDIASATGMRLTDCREVLLPAGDFLRLKASKTGKKADFELALSEVLPNLIARRRAVKASHLMLLSTPTGRRVSASMLRSRWDSARLLARWRLGMEGDLASPDSTQQRAAYGLAQAIGDMYLRDTRKMAADAAESDEDAAQLLQHSSVSLTRKHYRSRATKLVPVR